MMFYFISLLSQTLAVRTAYDQMRRMSIFHWPLICFWTEETKLSYAPLRLEDFTIWLLEAQNEGFCTVDMPLEFDVDVPSGVEAEEADLKKYHPFMTTSSS